MKKTDIEVYNVDTEGWYGLYIVINPDDSDGDIFTIGNSLFGDKAYFGPDQIDGLIELFQELKVKYPHRPAEEDADGGEPSIARTLATKEDIEEMLKKALDTVQKI